MNPATRRQLAGLAALGGVVLAAALLLSPREVLAGVRRLVARPVAFGLALVALYLVRPALAWPISALSILVGYAYGLAVGVPVALAGAVVTCLPPFVLARYARTDRGVLGHARRSGEALIDVAGPTRGLVAARLAPLPADGVSYVAGLAGVTPGAYVLATAVGEIPWVTTAVYAGTSMRTLAVDGVHAGLPLVVGAAALAVLVVAGPVYRHLRGGEATPH